MKKTLQAHLPEGSSFHQFTNYQSTNYQSTNYQSTLPYSTVTDFARFRG
jgi:hypothetical protein